MIDGGQGGGPPLDGMTSGRAESDVTSLIRSRGGSRQKGVGLGHLPCRLDHPSGRDLANVH